LSIKNKKGLPHLFWILWGKKREPSEDKRRFLFSSIPPSKLHINSCRGLREHCWNIRSTLYYFGVDGEPLIPNYRMIDAVRWWESFLR
jgi:hypothetical protein